MDVILRLHLNLTINPSTTSAQLTVTECDTYTWNGTAYTTSVNVYTLRKQPIQMAVILQQHLNLTINLSTTSSSSNVTECDTYTWNGYSLYDM